MSLFYLYNQSINQFAFALYTRYNTLSIDPSNQNVQSCNTHLCRINQDLYIFKYAEHYV